MPQGFLIAIGHFVTAGLAVGATAATIGMTVLMTGVSMGLSLVSKLLMKPKLNLGADNRWAQVSYPSTNAARLVAYGTVRTGGIVTLQKVLGPKGEDFWRLYTLTGHEIDSINGTYFDDDLATTDGGTGNGTGKYVGILNIYTRLGAAGETHFAELTTATAGAWTSNDRQDGCAKVLIKTKWDADKWPNGYPQKVSFAYKGRKVYDPRTGLTAWSDNPALIFRDYIKDPVFGLGATDDELDDAAIIAAANICDEDVALKAGGTEKRYRCNGAFSTDADPFEVLRGILSSMAGRISYSGSKVGCVAGAWTAPSVTLTDDDFRGGLRVPARHSRKDLFNSVRGTYRNPSLNYEEDSYPAVQKATYVAEDGQEKWTQLDLPFTTSPTMAQRLARIHLERHRRQIGATGNLKLSGYQAQVNDVVQLTHSRFGWTDKTFEVAECTLVGDTVEEDNVAFPVLGVDVVLRETDASVYAWNPATDENAPTAPVSAGGLDPSVVAQPTGITLTSVARESEGVKRPCIEVTWTAPNDIFVQSGGMIHIYMKEGAGSYIYAGFAQGDDTNFLIGNVEVGKQYTVQLVSENSYGAQAAPVTSLAHTVTMTTSTRLVGLDSNGNLISPDYIAGDGNVFARTPIIGGGFIENGNFEASGVVTPPPAWKLEGTATVTYETVSQQSGTRSVKIVTPNQYHGIRTVKEWPVVPGQIWKIAGYAKAEGGKEARIQLRFVDGSGNYIGSIQPNTTSATWTYLSMTGTVPDNAVKAYIIVGCWSVGGGTVYFDNVGLVRQANMDDEVEDGDVRRAMQAANASYRPLANPLHANDDGTQPVVTIDAFTMRITDLGDKAINGGSVSCGAGNYGRTAFVYYDDPTSVGGAVVFNVTYVRETALNGSGRYYAGSISLPRSGGAATTGNNDGGAGAQYSRSATLMPSLYIAPSWNNPANAIDSDNNNYSDATSSLSNLVYEAYGFQAFNNLFTENKLTIIHRLMSITGAGVSAKLDYSLDDGANWINLRTITAADAAAVSTIIDLAPTQRSDKVRVRLTLPGGGGGLTAQGYAGTAADNATYGSIAWTGPTNAQGAPNATTAAASASATLGVGTHYLWLTGFGFAVPGTATIQGVSVRITRKGTYVEDGSGYPERYVTDSVVKLIKAGAVTGISQADGSSPWPSVLTAKDYGSSSYLWGATLTPTDVNASNFGVAISAYLINEVESGSTAAYIDSVQVTVHYANTTSGATGRLYSVSQKVSF
jgi:hypothetical protein